MNIFKNIIGTCICQSGDDEENIVDRQQDRDIQEVKADIRTIKENHLYHIENDINELKMDVKLIHQSLMDIKIRLQK